MKFRFMTVAIVILLIGGGIATAVVLAGDTAAPISRVDDSKPDGGSDIERDLDAALKQDDEIEPDEAPDDDVDAADEDDTENTNDDTNDSDDDNSGSGGSGVSGGSGGSGEG